MMNNQPKTDFKAYQQAFTERIRRPDASPMPNQVNPERMALYETLIFNNLLESVSLCFPVAREVLDEDAWKLLVREYFASYASNTPIFREIPQTFVEFLTERHSEQALTPPFLLSLCHYEWIELLLSTQNTEPAPDNLVSKLETAEDLLNHALWFVSPLLLLHYDYPVHTISAENQPAEAQPTQLLVYRDGEDKIQFVALNATTYLLLRRLIEDQALTQTVLTELSEQLQQPTEAVTGFGLEFLNNFYQKGILQGYLSND